MKRQKKEPWRIIVAIISIVFIIKVAMIAVGILIVKWIAGKIMK